MSAARAGVVAALSAVALLATGCSYSQLPPVGSLTSATDTQFEGPYSVSVSIGSAGPEISDGQQFWWVNVATAQLTVSNHTAAAAALTVVATVKPPPCSAPATVVFTPPSGSPVSVEVDATPGALSLPVNVGAGQTAVVTMATSGSGCRIPTDTRRFFAALFNLQARVT